MRFSLLLTAALITVAQAGIVHPRQWQDDGSTSLEMGNLGEEGMTPEIDVAAPPFGGEVDTISREDVTPILPEADEDESPTSVSESSVLPSVTPSATASTTAPSATSETEKTEEEKKKEEEEIKKQKEKEAQSARCSKVHYEEVDGEYPYAPFCNPRDGQPWKASQRGFYQITWDPTFFSSNASVEISLQYEDPLPGTPITIKKSDYISPNLGIWEVMPEEGDLNFGGIKHQNTTLRIVIASTQAGKSGLKGPRVLLMSKNEPKKKEVEKEVSKKAAAIAVPVVFIVAVGFALMLHYTLRTERRIGAIRIGGKRGRRHGYGGGSKQSRMERLKAARGGSIRLDDERTMPGDNKVPDWELASVEPQSPFDDRHAVGPQSPSSPDRTFAREKRIY
ncbi:hypothetical protein BJ508DRAFT_44204 [Ascobolus immersus RN42]|uniref:Mid2 domain-containing protein n=1 Tax=Ascobolus immersus RN42 TaxID=1160509 RepID=A0A3N4HJ22_ASCIM|nr:hypothetical protein BJ508DRAFT_44204 [Ascobolus immersus RN42]